MKTMFGGRLPWANATPVPSTALLLFKNFRRLIMDIMLERVLQSELNDAARACAQNLPHVGAAQDRRRRAEVRPVEGVEELRPELQPVILIDWNVLEERHIPGRRARTVEQPAPRRSVQAR